VGVVAEPGAVGVVAVIAAGAAPGALGPVPDRDNEIEEIEARTQTAKGNRMAAEQSKRDATAKLLGLFDYWTCSVRKFLRDRASHPVPRPRSRRAPCDL
jgi:hypothetical protein